MKSIRRGLACSLLMLLLVVLQVTSANEPPASLKDGSAPAVTGAAATGAVTTEATTEAVDPVILRIRDQGLNHSQVMSTLDTLCNVIGPRLTGSPGQVRASEWTAINSASGD